MSDSYECVNGNTLLSDNAEILLRQVHPAHMQEDGETPSKQAFRPSGDHDLLLSTRREEMGATEAYEEWVGQGRASQGTWGVAVGEAVESGAEAVDDADHVQVRLHAAINFQKVGGTGKQVQCARKLRAAAVERAVLYRP